MSERINDWPVGLPIEQDPLRSMYLVRRRSDGTHWQVLAIHFARREAVVFDYKNPEAEPMVESFDNLMTRDRMDTGPGGPVILAARR